MCYSVRLLPPRRSNDPALEEERRAHALMRVMGLPGQFAAGKGAATAAGAPSMASAAKRNRKARRRMAQAAAATADHDADAAPPTFAAGYYRGEDGQWYYYDPESGWSVYDGPAVDVLDHPLSGHWVVASATADTAGDGAAGPTSGESPPSPHPSTHPSSQPSAHAAGTTAKEAAVDAAAWLRQHIRFGDDDPAAAAIESVSVVPEGVGLPNGDAVDATEADDDEAESEEDNGSATTDSAQEDGANKKRRRKKRRRAQPPAEITPAIRKYWNQRYLLFSRFDEGVQLDEGARAPPDRRRSVLTDVARADSDPGPGAAVAVARLAWQRAGTR